MGKFIICFLSVVGFEYLRVTGYPLPAYSTLNRRIQNVKLKFDVINDFLQLLEHKVSLMDDNDRYCVISYDEMIISLGKCYKRPRSEIVFGLSSGSTKSMETDHCKTHHAKNRI